MPAFDFFSGLILLLLSLTIPGYSLSLAFFPNKKNLDSLERLTFSFAFSLAFVPLIILIEMQLLGVLLTASMAWSNFIGITVLGFVLWAVRARRVSVPKSVRKLLKAVDHKSEGVPLFFEKWL